MALKPGLTPLKNVVVRSIEEVQTLAANQIVVNLAKTTVVPLVVYVAGVPLRVNEESNATNSTTLSLTKGYAASTKIALAQNDPFGTFPDPLLSAQCSESGRCAGQGGGSDQPGRLQQSRYGRSDTRILAAEGLRKEVSVEVKVCTLVVERRQRIPYERELAVAVVGC